MKAFFHKAKVTAFAALTFTAAAVVSQPFESVSGDPAAARIYTLSNGMRVYMSVNKAQPRISTNIAVRTGSKQDPADATGLAHYLEHMLFKGTSKLGALNWAAEKPLLDAISGEYEKLRATTEEEARKEIYARIDSLSQMAAGHVAANEYDKFVTSLGAQGTNAYTSYERTVYVNDIPSTELEKWATVESERFGELVLRLFHTELEAVYEEFNRGQDSDNRQAYYALMNALFPTHPYGQQTTIGTSDHLKNPSMVKIHDYFKRRYVPSNMAIVLAGDLDPEPTVALLEKHFGKLKGPQAERLTMPLEQPFMSPHIVDVVGSEAEFELVGFRLGGAHTNDALYLEMLTSLLFNGTAGILDLDLVQAQKALSAYAFSSVGIDYSWLVLSAAPREGQALEEVRQLLLEGLEKVKRGEFDEWMLAAVVRNAEKDLLMAMESNRRRVYEMTDAFILDKPWASVVDKHKRMAAITKADMQMWAANQFAENYVAVNKRFGERNNPKVDKPAITQVPIVRDQASAFFTEINALPSARRQPEFIDFKSAISTAQAEKVPVRCALNHENGLFYLYYVVDMGKLHNPLLPLAMHYLPLLGTSKMSAADVRKELYRLGLEFDVSANDEQCFVTLIGLDEVFDEGVSFFESVLNDLKPDAAAYAELVDDVLKKRADEKLNKNQILMSGLSDYAQFGPKNPFNTRMSEAEMRALNPAELCTLLGSLFDFEHRILYYGPRPASEVGGELAKLHVTPASLKPVPPAAAPVHLPTETSKVLFVHYDMVQTELYMLHRDVPLDVNLAPQQLLFGEYFGGGLSSIVFQEIRESRALAYSAYAGYSLPAKAGKPHYVRGYLGTQANKLGDATVALLSLMSTLPKAETQFEQARIGAMKSIESTKSVGQNVLWAYESAEKRGIDYDLNSTIYSVLQRMTFDDLQSFFDKHIKQKPFTYMVIGNRDLVDFAALEKLGPVQELSLEQVFGF